MKKLLVILILVIYLPAISGMAINSFYCCGKLASVRIQLISNTGGGHNPNENGNCCENNMQYFKVHDAQQASVSEASVKAPVLSLNFRLPLIEAGTGLYSLSHTHKGSFLHSPPIRTSVSLFLQNRNLLI